MASFLIIIGGLLLLGYVAHVVGKRAHVPRVTLLLLLGIASGPYVFDLVPRGIVEWFPTVADMALAMVGFLLGERLSLANLRESGRVVLGVSLSVMLATGLLVGTAIFVLSGDVVLALALAGIASATAPAATVDVLREFKARGPLTDTVWGVVAIDDAWCIILFSILLVAAEGVAHGSSNGFGDVMQGLREVFGAMGLGIVLGIPMAWLTGRVRPGEPTLLEAAGFVFLCAGAALALDVSYLLTCMVLGATVANRATHHVRPFRDIEGISEPFLIVFFFLAGYGLDIPALLAVGLVGSSYFFARIAGRLLGAWVGGHLSRAQPVVRQRVGWCLLAQAGVPLGLALHAAERLPGVGAVLLTIVIGTTVLFDLIGPLLIYRQLRLAGEIPSEKTP
jgi:Kef-type K+ transport system membrane component KefB